MQTLTQDNDRAIIIAPGVILWKCQGHMAPRACRERSLNPGETSIQVASEQVRVHAE
jgi:hypothetical protein